MRSFVAFSLSILFSLVSVWSSLADNQAAGYWPTIAWTECAPEEQGMSSEVLRGIDSYIRERMPQTTSILLARGGAIVFEKYYEGTADTLRGVLSATKSIVSVLVGIGIEQGAIPTTDSRIFEVLTWLDKEKTARQASDIEMGHLLCMTSGISPPMGRAIGRPEIQDLLSKALRSNPGELFEYNNVNSNLLSMIISEKSGMATSDFAKRYLFEPLGIVKYYWEQNAEYTVGAAGLSLTTRDLAKIVHLYLRKGMWDGKRIVPEKWVERSIESHAATGEIYRGKPLDYGYHWWIIRFDEHEAFLAFGFGGQFACGIPDLDLVVAMTGKYDVNMKGERYDIIPDVILRAILEK